jgi:hypothetical protein
MFNSGSFRCVGQRPLSGQERTHLAPLIGSSPRSRITSHPVSRGAFFVNFLVRNRCQSHKNPDEEPLAILAMPPQMAGHFLIYLLARNFCQVGVTLFVDCSLTQPRLARGFFFNVRNLILQCHKFDAEHG